MNLPRIFANAVARRVAFVVVGVVCAFFASCFSEAYAQYSGCAGASGTLLCDTRAQAAAACEGERAKVTAPNFQPTRCDLVGPTQLGAELYGNYTCRRSGGAFTCTYGGGGATFSHFNWRAECPDGGTWNEASRSCETCASRAPLGAGAWLGVNADMQMCQDGCTFEGGIGGGVGVGVCLPVVIDGITYQHCTSWGPTGDACSAGVGNGSLAPSDGDGDGTSDGNDSSPNNPGSGGGGKGGKPGEDGSSSCGGPGQPVCDGTNEGSGKGNTSGGGGNCQTPPSSTGDAILAQIAYQAWATRCAVEGLGEGGIGTGPGDGDGDQPDWTKGDGPDAPEDTSAEDVSEASNWGIGISADLLNTENIFGESSCPALPSLSIMGYDIDTASFSWWCTLVSIMRAAILIMGAFTAIQILLGRF